MPLRTALFTLTAALVLLSFARRARAEDPWFGFGDAKLEDRYADGEVDEDDLARIPGLARRGVGAGDLTSRTWLSLVGTTTDFLDGHREYAGLVVVGAALDRIAQGPVHVTSSRPIVAFAANGGPTKKATGTSTPTPTSTSTSTSTSTPTPTPTPTSTSTAAPTDPETPVSPLPAPSRPLAATLARGAVRAAWRASGMDSDDSRVDDMIARSRTSAALPETRVRAMRLFTDTQSTTTYVDSTGHVVDALGANLTLEARLTWRFDRLLYADDEPTLERVRLEHQDARSRIAARVLDLLFAWQRAILDAGESPVGSRRELDATLRRWESEVALDVLTGGWFGAQPAVRTAP